MSRLASLLFAVAAYAVFFATFLYLIVFVGDLSFANRTVDVGPYAPPATALVIDVGLIALFGIQHSVMARQGFKRAWTRIVPPHLERSIFVLAASLVLLLMFVLWRPIDGIVWKVDPISAPMLHDILWLLFWIGWSIVLLSTFLINHFELFGLQQAWLHMRGQEPSPPAFRTPFLYRWVRHPLYLGFFCAFWAAPEMTAGHLVLAAGFWAYMLIAIRFEERDLVGIFGQKYEDYRARVGMLVPRFRRDAPQKPREKRTAAP
jgi:methanethiol S-methyltransferase